MPLKLTYFADTLLPIELEGFTPCWAQGKSLAEIGKFPVLHGNRQLPISELFRVEGDASDGRLVFAGDLSGVHGIGAGLQTGFIHVEGHAGRHLGSGMSGGEIHVAGNASDWLGAEMRGGLIDVRGDAGDQVGAAYPGAPKGMSGGTILVHGSVGQETGLAMRRGLIAVGGPAGDFVGRNLLAGTILVYGDCGNHPGAGMKRGTLGLFGEAQPELLPTYTYACTIRPQFLSLLFSEVKRRGFPIDESTVSVVVDVYNGDQLALGKGEILSRPR